MKRIFRPLYLSLAFAFTLASCGPQKMISTLVENIDNLPLKTTPVAENDLKCLDCPIDTDNDDEDTQIENVSGEIIGNNRVETTKTENDSIEKVSVKVNGKEIINTEVRKSKN